MLRLNTHPNTDQDHRRARALRNGASAAEQKLWIALRREAAKHGLKFRRQAALHPFIVDFACMSARLLIEIDGYSHEVRQDYDQKREAKLREMGYTVVRFMNEDVMENVESVVQVIVEQAEKLKSAGLRRAPTPCPLPRGEGEF